MSASNTEGTLVCKQSLHAGLLFAALIFRAAFGSRVVGVLVSLAGIAYAVDAFVKVVLPQASPWVSMLTTRAEAADLAAVVWLLFVGFGQWRRAAT